jgi:hypothetical protein
MARFLGAGAVLLATVLSGCGDKGSGGGGTGGAGTGSAKDAGPVGVWTIDLEPMIAKQRGPMLETVKTQVAAIQEQLKGLSGTEQAQARAAALAAVPAELKELTEAMLTSEAAGLEAANKLLAERLGGVDATFDIKAGGTFTSSMSMGSDAQRVEGTWTMEGDKLTFTATTKDGKPPEGRAKKPLVLLWKDGRLAPADPDELPFSFKRK